MSQKIIFLVSRLLILINKFIFNVVTHNKLIIYTIKTPRIHTYMPIVSFKFKF